MATPPASWADEQARRELGALVQHEVKFFCGLVQNRSMSMSFGGANGGAGGAGGAGAGGEENLHRYIALVKDEDGSSKGSLEHTWRVLFSSPSSSFSVAPLRSEARMQRKQAATRVCVALAAQLKAAGPGAAGAALEPELRRCLLDAEREAGVLYKYYANRHFAGHAKDAAEALACGLLKASFVRHMSRRLEAAAVASSAAASGGLRVRPPQRWVDFDFPGFEVERRHTAVWVMGSAGMRAAKLQKQIERALRFGKFEHQAPGSAFAPALGVCVSLDARSEEGAGHKAFLEALLAEETRAVEGRVEQHRAATRAKAEAEEALHALPHIASTASIAMCYAFCSGSV